MTENTAQTNQQITIEAYKANGWTYQTTIDNGRTVVMTITDVNPVTGKKTDLTAYIDINGGGRIV